MGIFSVIRLSLLFILFSSIEATYPNFDDNPLFTNEMREAIRPHLIPLNHPYKVMLDTIFIQSRATSNQNTLVAAGFEVLMTTPFTYVTIARHVLVPGYLFKIYLDSEERCKEGRPGWEWLLRRCQGAANIRAVIKQEKIKHFLIPDKWLYPLPRLPLSGEAKQEPVILLVTDMKLASPKTTREAWRNVGKKELKELYAILVKGYGSTFLPANVPFTQHKKFAFVDTEHPQRQLNLSHANSWISEDMRPYWNKLIQ